MTADSVALAWSERFLNDELWLRSRRTLLLGLESSALAATASDNFAYMDSQADIGRRLLPALRAQLGLRSYQALVSEAFLGTENARFQRRLPYILAFGYEYARCIQQLQGAEAHPAAETARQLAALFNLGIVLVDKVTDHPAFLARFRQILSAERLQALFAGGASAPLHDEVDIDANAELAVLTNIIDCFFVQAHRLANSAPAPTSDPRPRERAAPTNSPRRREDALTHAPRNNDTPWEALQGSLVTAYTAQIAAANGTFTEEVSQAKSVVPFVIVPLLVSLARPATDIAAVAALGERIGSIFWRIDDLCDLVSDYHEGQVNVVLCRAGLQASSTTRQPRGDLIRLCHGDAIDQVASEALNDITQLIEQLTARGANDAARRDLLRWLHGYIIDWLT
jgi:hypothetical protein